MKYIVAFFGISALIAATNAAISTLVPSTTIIRTPQYDSAIIHSDRVGGSFAYSTVEGHAYQDLTPLLRTALHPVQLRYHLNAVPVALPAAQHYYIQNPILTHLSPSQAIEISGDSSLKQVPQEEKANETEETKVDEDTVSVESA